MQSEFDDGVAALVTLGSLDQRVTARRTGVQIVEDGAGVEVWVEIGGNRLPSGSWPVLNCGGYCPKRSRQEVVVLMR